MLIVVADKVLHGDVPKRLKGPHSKCGRSGNRRESSNLSISVMNHSCFARMVFIFAFICRILTFIIKHKIAQEVSIMDSSFYLASGGITIVFGLLLGLVAFSFFRRFKKVNSLLNRAHEMTGTANGKISEVVSVRRRNRSFRWTNEYPVITYTVDSKDYTTQLDFAEKRKGHYDLGGNYRVCYIPSDPSCCIVDEFRKPMQSNRTQAIVFTVIFAIITFNFVISGLSQIFTA